MSSERIHQEALAVAGDRVAEMVGYPLVHVETRGHAKRGGKVDTLLAIRLGLAGLFLGIYDGNGHRAFLLPGSAVIKAQPENRGKLFFADPAAARS